MKEHKDARSHSTNTPKHTKASSHSHHHVDFSNLSSANVIDLQRMVGNKATQQMLERAVVNTTAPPPDQHPLFGELQARMQGKVDPQEIRLAVNDLIRYLDADKGIYLEPERQEALFAAAPDPKAMAAIAFMK
jgi:hypothetical protein